MTAVKTTLCPTRIFWFVISLTLSGCHTLKQNSSVGANSPQIIPGRVQCEWYDRGGEGKAYHDSDSINNGSGKLNPANGSYLNEFRMREGVDISYTKSKNIDNNPFNVTVPELEQLYVGWTVPGEWFECSISVKHSGNYRVGMMYTSNGDGRINLQFNDAAQTVPIVAQSTYNAQDTIAWRQWHHWRKIEDVGTVSLKKGSNKMKVEIVKNGNLNLDYIEFVKRDE